MSKLPAYSKYKASGTEWLGEVPEHWEVRRIGYYFNECREKVSDKDFPALSVTKQGIVPQLDTAAKSDDGDNRKRVSKGDFVINSRSDRKGSAGVSELEGSVSLICTVLQPQEHIDTSFVHHLLRCQPFQEEFYRNGKGIVADLWSTNFSEMRDILLGMPPLPEQSAIAAFLDRETAKIDALIAEQEKLITLLAEKRQSVISHAVTKGLNPKVLMKESGVDWLGEVPKHWTVVPLKRLIIRATSGPRGWSDLIGDEGDTFFQSQNIGYFMDVALDDPKRIIPPIDADTERARLQADDVVICITGGRTGAIAHVPEDIEPAYINQHVCLLRPAEAISGRFLAYSLFSFGSQEQLSCASYGLKQGLGLDQVRSTILLKPPAPEEQRKIVTHLDRQVAHIDALTAEAHRAIDLLKEHRSALISAAVTGKIDVRGLAPAAAAA